MCFAPQQRALFDIATSKSVRSWVFCSFWLGNVLRATTACNFSSLIWPGGSAPAALASLLFNPPEPQIIRKTQCFASSHLDLLSSEAFSFLIFFHLLFSSLLWLFPPVLFHLSILSEVWLLNILRWDLYAVRSLSCEILFAVRCDIHRMTSHCRESIYNGIHCITVHPLHWHPSRWHPLPVTSIFPVIIPQLVPHKAVAEVQK